MKIQELRELPEMELKTRLHEEEENLANLYFQKATSQLESPIKIRMVRRTIARMHTVLREKTTGAEAPSATPAPTAAN